MTKCAVNPPSKRLFDDMLASVDMHAAEPSKANYAKMMMAIRKCRANLQARYLLSEYMAKIINSQKRGNK